MTDHSERRSPSLAPVSSDAPQGLRGAGWVLSAVLIFAAIVFTAWAGGWSINDRHATAPSQHHSTTGAAPKSQ